MWIDPNKFAKSIHEKWLQMCNAGVEDGLKELREHLLVIITIWKRQFHHYTFNSSLSCKLKSRKKLGESTSSAADNNKMISK